MIHLAVQGLARRRGRTAAAIVGIALAVALAYVMAGVTSGFDREVDRTLDALGSDLSTPEGASGLLTGGMVDQTTGPEGSQPLLFSRDIAPGGELDLNLFGLDHPAVDVVAGRTDPGPGEIVIDESAGVGLGDTVDLKGTPLEVVGVTSGVRLYAGGPVAFTSVKDMQDIYYGGQRGAMAFVGGEAGDTPGLKAISRTTARADLIRPVQGAVVSLTLIRTLLWIMVGGIVLSTGRMAILDRRQELAALRCLGATGRALGVTLAFEGALISLIGAVWGVNLGMALAPLFPLEVVRSIPTTASILGLSVAVSLVAGVLAGWQITRLPPAAAFRGAR